MDMLTHCRAMAVFCRQRAEIEAENEAFWLEEAEQWASLAREAATVRATPKTFKTERVKRASA
jgi:hypothetical protein